MIGQKPFRVKERHVENTPYQSSTMRDAPAALAQELEVKETKIFPANCYIDNWRFITHSRKYFANLPFITMFRIA